MPNQSAKIELADLLIRKAGLIRTVRDELAKQGVVYWNGLTRDSRRHRAGTPEESEEKSA